LRNGPYEEGKGPRVCGQGARAQSHLEAESFLRIRHPKEGTNWPNVRVLNERSVILGKGALWGREMGPFGVPQKPQI